MPFTILADPHSQNWAMASVGVLNGCFLYSFSYLQPHALLDQNLSVGVFELFLIQDILTLRVAKLKA